MIIVLEGPDGTGKTTLAKKFIECCGASYLHLTYRCKERHDLYLKAAFNHCIDKIVSTRKPIILDRWWISEMIYAEVFRNGTKWPQLGRELHLKLMQAGGCYVFCLPVSTKDYLERFDNLKKTRAEMFDSVTDLLKLYNDTFYCGSMLKNDNYLNIVSNRGLMHKDCAYKYSFEELNEIQKYYFIRTIWNACFFRHLDSLKKLKFKE